FKSVCASAEKFPAAIVSTAMIASNGVADGGNITAAGKRNANAAAFVPIAMNVVTGAGAPWYTSGTHRWKGNTLTLKNKLAATSAPPAITSGPCTSAGSILESVSVPVPA